MNCDQASERIVELLRGELAGPAATELSEHLRDCPSCAREAAELPALWQDMAARAPEEAPSPALRARFYTMLAEERRTARQRAPLGERLTRALGGLWPRRPAWQMGVAAALLVVGVVVGRASGPLGGGKGEIGDLRQEVRSLSHLVAISMLQQDSAASRLQGVSYGRRAAASDGRVLAALVEAATRDPNVNVRLAAIDALSPELARPAVRDELLASFPSQPSPLLQIALVDAVAGADGTAARRALSNLLDLPRLDPAVRQHLGKAVGTIS